MEQNSQDVPQVSSPAASEGVTPQPQSVVEPAPAPTPAPPIPGSNTPESNLLAALQEERELRKEESRLRREAEDKLRQLGADPSQPSYISDEGKQLKSEVDSVRGELAQIKDERALDALFIQYPLLKENVDKFRAFRESEHPQMKIESVAKLFLVENGLLESQRVGLENPTGGDRAPVAKNGMSPEEVSNLRQNNWPKYQDLLSKGLLDMVE